MGDVTVQEEMSIERGEIHLAGGKERYILIPMRAYAEIVNSLLKIMGEGAAGPLYYLGKRIGLGLVEELSRRMGSGGGAERLTEEYSRFLEELGFGRIEVVEEAGGHAVVKMLSPPSLAGAGVADEAVEKAAREGKRICYIEAGMMAGVFEKILGGRWRGVELEHGPPENPYCVIRVERVG